MTDQHPLTDEICEEIAASVVCKPFDSPDYTNYIRSGADWQLEQVIRYLENDLEFVLWGGSTTYLTDDFMDKFKKAMRPQVVDLPQANSDVCGEEGSERALQRTFEENDELMRLLADGHQQVMRKLAEDQ